jgi:hypothetical protein
MKITFQGGPYNRRTVDLMSFGGSGNLVVIDRSQPGGSFVLYSMVRDTAHYIRTSDTPFTGAYVALDKINPAEPGTPAERATQAGHYEHGMRDLAASMERLGSSGARMADVLVQFADRKYLFDEPVEVTALNEIVPATAEMEEDDCARCRQDAEELATEELDSHECAENLYEVKGVEFCRVCGATTEGGL